MPVKRLTKYALYTGLGLKQSTKSCNETFLFDQSPPHEDQYDENRQTIIVAPHHITLALCRLLLCAGGQHPMMHFNHMPSPPA